MKAIWPFLATIALVVAIPLPADAASPILTVLAPRRRSKKPPKPQEAKKCVLDSEKRCQSQAGQNAIDKKEKGRNDLPHSPRFAP